MAMGGNLPLTMHHFVQKHVATCMAIHLKRALMTIHDRLYGVLDSLTSVLNPSPNASPFPLPFPMSSCQFMID